MLRWQYPLLMVVSLLIAFFLKKSNDLIMPLFLIYWTIYGFLAFANSPSIRFKILFSLFVFYVLFSGINYCFNGIPFVAYYSDIRGFIIPMFFTFIGLINSDKFIYKVFVLSTIFCVVVGLFLYFFQPSWYVSFKVSSVENAWFLQEANINETTVMRNSLTSRFSSFFSNGYPIAYYSVFSLCIIMNDLYKAREQKIFKSIYIQIIIICLLIIAILLTLTRVAILYMFALLFVYWFFGVTHVDKSAKNTWIIYVVLFVLLASTIVKLSSTEYGSFLFDNVLGRLGQLSVSDAIEGSRTSQNQAVIAHWDNKIFGDGMGSFGGMARSLGRVGITDGNWTRILVEYGIVGIVLFLTVLLYSLFHACHYYRYYAAEISIVIYTMLSMLIADSLSKGHMIILFWFALGRMWNYDYLNNLIKNINKI